MSTPQRLPVVNGDDGTWGDIIRQYLKKEHYDDGTDNAVNGGHQNVTIRAGSASQAPLTFTSGTLLSSAAAGSMEFNTDSLYFTITSGTVRKKVAIYDDSSGATGDLYYRDSGGNFVRLGIGSTGQVLKTVSGLPAWSTVNGTFTTGTQTSNYTITSTDTVVFADATSANVTVTLPLASGTSGYQFYVKRIDGSAHTVTITHSGSDTIDGASSLTLDLQYTAVALVSNGSAWYIL